MADPGDDDLAATRNVVEEVPYRLGFDRSVVDRAAGDVRPAPFVVAAVDVKVSALVAGVDGIEPAGRAGSGDGHCDAVRELVLGGAVFGRCSSQAILRGCRRSREDGRWPANQQRLQ